MSERSPSMAVIVAGMLFLGALIGWFARPLLFPGTGPETDSAGERPVQPDIFLITIDTLRADHLPPYGYVRQTSPWITGLADDAQLFQAVSATSSWTTPSVASLLTGLLPTQHGLSDAPSLSATDPDVELPVLSDQAVTLAERLKAVGYETYAIVSNAQLVPETGLDQGFDEYTCLGFSRAPRVELMVERSGERIRDRDGPVFVWVHYFDPHDPYVRGGPVTYTWARDYDGYQRSRRKMAGATGVDRRPLHKLMMEDLLQRSDLQRGGAGIPYLQALYDSEIRLVDDHVQLLYGDLGIEDDDVVVITADHGEEFRDHGQLGHRLNLYEETVRVPMLISWPAVWPRPYTYHDRISQVDLVPTLAEIGGAPIREDDTLARSLVPLMNGGELRQDYPVVAELQRTGGRRWQAIYDGMTKLIIDPDDPTQRELSDLMVDPREQDDLAATRPVYVEELARALSEHLASVPRLEQERFTGELPEEVIEQLKSMGYLEEGDETRGAR